jgi:hypothetical protein
LPAKAGSVSLIYRNGCSLFGLTALTEIPHAWTACANPATRAQGLMSAPVAICCDALYDGDHLTRSTRQSTQKHRPNNKKDR